MPASHRIDREQGVVVSRLWGSLGAAEIDAHRRSIRDDPDFHPQLRYIVDLRGLAAFEYSGARVRHVAATQNFRGPQRRALVASSDEQYGMARMFATFAALEGEVVEVFREWGQAVEWLGLTGELAQDPALAAAE